MFVVEIFLPLADNQGLRFDKAAFDEVRTELAAEHGGVTAFVRAPAIGLWEDEAGQVRRDEIVVFEVMCERLDKAWWNRYRIRLQRAFKQDEVLIRATPVDRL